MHNTGVSVFLQLCVQDEILDHQNPLEIYFIIESEASLRTTAPFNQRPHLHSQPCRPQHLPTLARHISNATVPHVHAPELQCHHRPVSFHCLHFTQLHLQ